jgi:hypothetical protein
MPDLQRIRDAIVEAQDEALAKLRHAALADHEYLIAAQRVVSLTTRTLRLLDEAWVEVE